ncbi:MAG TPA: family 16 glycosylhydrolase [Candidatus Dormibacteraeota bacterium]|nr:family 16 glycosylhydrolase [Candidatus Dormibacteraeota bacterium]
MKSKLFLCSISLFLLLTSAFGQTNPGWTLVWSDEFNQPDGSSPNSANWNYDTGGGGWGNSELENYTSRTNNVRIQNGQLIIEARQESFQGSSYTSGRIKTENHISWAYGRLEARIKIPRGQGIWPAFWTLGTNITSLNWPTCGEIDMMENIGKEPTIVHGTAHGPGYSGGNGIGGPYSLPGSGTFADGFHNYAIEWTTNSIKWFVDNVQYFSIVPTRLPSGGTWVFTAPQFIILNVAVGGQWPGNPDGTTVFPQQMLVDYVRVYAPSNLVACSPNLLTNPGFEVGGLANWTIAGGSGNNVLESIKNVPVHSGSNVFKVYGQFIGATNDSGIRQDNPTTPGTVYTANAWMLTPGNDTIAGLNSAWYEVSFRDSFGSTLSMYRTAIVNSNTPAGGWMNLAVTNQLNPLTMALIGSVTNLVAPAGASLVRCRCMFKQPPANAAGSVLFDDLNLSTATTTAVSVPSAFARSGTTMNLAFPTYLNLPYQVQWKANLTDLSWQPLTNMVGDGLVNSVSFQPQFSSRFYQVVRPCN